MALSAETIRPDPGHMSEEPGFGLRPKGGGRYEVRLWGRFLPGWLGPFTAGLTRRRLNILGGSARKVSPSVWSAVFEVDAVAAANPPEEIDFLALVSGPGESDPGALRLESFHLDCEQDGSLCVEVRAEDQLGFLSGILKSFALFSLFPAELAVETRGSRIFDRFRLKGVGGSTPSAAAVGGLRGALEKMTEH